MGLISRVSSRTYRPPKMPPKIQKAKAAMSSGKGKKKKWYKGKVRDKLQNAALFDKPTWDKFKKEVPGYKMITPAVCSERMKVRASLAKFGLRKLHEEGLITKVVGHSALMIYTKNE